MGTCLCVLRHAKYINLQLLVFFYPLFLCIFLVINLTFKLDSYKATDFAGSTEGFQDGSPQDSKFKLFEGIIFDGKTNTCFVSDNGFIRKILLSFL